MAIALHRLTGFPYGLWAGYVTQDGEKVHEYCHAVVIVEPGATPRWMDARGVRSGKPDNAVFMGKVEGVELLEVDEADVRAAFTAEEIPEVDISKAAQYALAKGLPSLATRVFYRGTTPGDSRRINEPFSEAKGLTFAARSQEAARIYGSSVERIEATPDAKILYEEDSRFWKLIGRKRPPNGFIGSAGRRGETMVEVVNHAIRRSREAGYDAVSFASDADLGTILLNEAAFNRNVQLASPRAVVVAPHVYAFGKCHALTAAMLDYAPGGQAMGLFVEGECLHSAFRLPNTNVMVDAHGATGGAHALETKAKPYLRHSDEGYFWKGLTDDEVWAMVPGERSRSVRQAKPYALELLRAADLVAQEGHVRPLPTPPAARQEQTLAH